eukprot:jgi/Mesvir1/12032/Mv00323-RA.1
MPGKKPFKFQVKDALAWFGELSPPLVIPFVVVAWLFERALIPLSNWIPVIFAVVIALKHGEAKVQRALEQERFRQRQVYLDSVPSTPAESNEWVAKLTAAIWPQFLERKLVMTLVPKITLKLDEKRPKNLESLEIVDFSFGTSVPVFSWPRCYRPPSGPGLSLLTGNLDWKTDGMKVVLKAKLGMSGPLKGKSVHMTVKDLAISGPLHIVPYMSERVLLIAFESKPQISVSVDFGSLKMNELPGFAGFVEKTLSETICNLMVLPRRKAIGLELVDLRKQAKGGVLTVTVVRCRDLKAADDGVSSDPFVELRCYGQKKSTTVKPKVLNPEYEESFEFDLLDDDGLLQVTVMDLDVGLKNDFLGSAEVMCKYMDDDSSCFWADNNGEPIVRRVQTAKEEFQVTLPLSGVSTGTITLRLGIKQWHFREGHASHGVDPSLLLLLSGQHGYTGRTLRVTVMEGRQATASSDITLKLQYGRMSAKSKVRTPAPSSGFGWEEEFEFAEQMGVNAIQISVRFGKKAYSEATVILDELLDPTGNCISPEQYYPLLAGHSGVASGADIRVRVEANDGVTEELKEATSKVSRLKSVKKRVTSKDSTAFERALSLGKCVVNVEVMQGRDLVAADRGGTSDPYVILTHGSAAARGAKLRTKTIPKTLAPVWNESFEVVDDGSQLLLTCYDEDLVGRDDFLGEAVVPYAGLVPGAPPVEIWLKLDKVPKGEVCVRLSLRSADAGRKSGGDEGGGEHSNKLVRVFSNSKKRNGVAHEPWPAELATLKSKLRTKGDTLDEDTRKLLDLIDKEHDALAATTAERDMAISERELLLTKIAELEAVFLQTSLAKSTRV